MIQQTTHQSSWSRFLRRFTSHPTRSLSKERVRSDLKRFKNRLLVRSGWYPDTSSVSSLCCWWCTYNYGASSRNVVCCVRQKNVLSIYLSMWGREIRGQPVQSSQMTQQRLYTSASLVGASPLATSGHSQLYSDCQPVSLSKTSAWPAVTYKRKSSYDFMLSTKMMLHSRQFLW